MDKKLGPGNLRLAVLQGNDTETRHFKALAAKSMGDINESGDAPFGGEVQMESKVYWWHEKYRPRKPKYYNRVHTGYEWNKYNQTHYDHDNPPPKVFSWPVFKCLNPDGECISIVLAQAFIPLHNRLLRLICKRNAGQSF